MKPTSFISDEEKMLDFCLLSKNEFLASYSYLTETEYDLTAAEVMRRCKHNYRNCGRRKDDAKMQKRYEHFQTLYNVWNGDAERVMNTMNISKNTYYRYLKRMRSA